MGVPVEYPASCEYGTRVRFRKHGLPGSAQPEGRTGEGILTLHWLGIEECWDVTLGCGEGVGLFPCLGDTMVPPEEGSGG